VDTAEVDPRLRGDDEGWIGAKALRESVVETAEVDPRFWGRMNFRIGSLTSVIPAKAGIHRGHPACAGMTDYCLGL
jgi:hypothetical protein